MSSNILDEPHQRSVGIAFRSVRAQKLASIAIDTIDLGFDNDMSHPNAREDQTDK